MIPSKKQLSDAGIGNEIELFMADEGKDDIDNEIESSDLE